MTDPIGPLLSAPPPAFADAQMAALAAAHYGLTGTVCRLTSERDLNLLLRRADGAGFVLKASNAAEPEPVTTMQTRALQHVARVAPALPVPRVVLAQDGRAQVPLPGGGLFRVLTYLEGTPLHAAPRSDAQRRAVGQALAGLARALHGFADPAADHVLLWDIQHLARLEPLLPAIADPVLRALARATLARFTAQVAPRLRGLPVQIAHGDLNPHNLLVSPADPAEVAGILDFGDASRTPRVCDVAVAASYQIDTAAPLTSLAAFVAGYHGINPLLPAEMDLLPDLICARLTATLAITATRAQSHPGNAAYILRNAPAAAAGLRCLTALDGAVLRAALAPQPQPQHQPPRPR